MIVEQFNGFAVGERVRVVNPGGVYMMGSKLWGDVWLEDMDEYIGKEMTIAVIDDELGCTFKEDQDVFNYAFPLSALEKLQ